MKEVEVDTRQQVETREEHLDPKRLVVHEDWSLMGGYRVLWVDCSVLGNQMHSIDWSHHNWKKKKMELVSQEVEYRQEEEWNGYSRKKL